MIEAEVILKKNGDLILRGYEAKVQELLDIFVKDKDEVYLKVRFDDTQKKTKTNSQLGYFMGHLAPMALSMLREWGWLQVKTKEAAISFLKAEIGLEETTFNEYDGTERIRLISLADADTTMMNNAINLLSVMLLEAGYTVMSPDEYKKGKKWGKREQP